MRTNNYSYLLYDRAIGTNDPQKSWEKCPLFASSYRPYGTGAGGWYKSFRNHVRRIEAGKSNITSRTAGKIAGFFNVEIAVLYASGFPKVRKIEEIPAVSRFYKDNENNPQFFISGKDESSIAYFVREILLKKKKYFLKEREVADVVNESKRKEYGKSFKSKAISQELIRLVGKGLLARKDKTGNGKRFLYYQPSS
ncbi:hypothetical protein EDD80_1027 [Anseongella ginsenosidimutans]|uniref:HTH cro/C1-type domain-containing protein n=1 Tax=Anseongella ginsenosidimutans TaxID=496056 RepID=A0A4R3KTY8_9SPHI|nr:helix-turn-helix transcriptional regulator [Anseongella ginsenosidimutans]QEC51505.1 hypothetical protein FRZ59_03475 [Anseongella ginsenosidimutans]TCS88817.1 hypothetical protein EDD80_1027 [Anseongella ginsenosidimutans]